MPAVEPPAPRRTVAQIPVVAPPRQARAAPAPSKSKAPLIVGAIVLLGAAGASAFFALGRKTPPPPATVTAPAPAAAPAPAPAVEPAPPPAAPTTAPPVAPAPAAAPAARPAPVAKAPPAPKPPPQERNSDDEQARLLATAERKYNDGNFLAAITDYRKAASIQPSAPAHVGLARALYDANKASEALSELKVATRVNARYAPAYLLLGEIHQGEGRTAEARSAYQTFLSLSPTGEQARAVREIIATQLK
jgi:tetratricopeptide (TPR) repeat protein